MLRSPQKTPEDRRSTLQSSGGVGRLQTMENIDNLSSDFSFYASGLLLFTFATDLSKSGMDQPLINAVICCTARLPSLSLTGYPTPKLGSKSNAYARPFKNYNRATISDRRLQAGQRFCISLSQLDLTVFPLQQEGILLCWINALDSGSTRTGSNSGQATDGLGRRTAGRRASLTCPSLFLTAASLCLDSEDLSSLWKLLTMLATIRGMKNAPRSLSASPRHIMTMAFNVFKQRTELQRQHVSDVQDLNIFSLFSTTTTEEAAAMLGEHRRNARDALVTCKSSHCPPGFL